MTALTIDPHDPKFAADRPAAYAAWRVAGPVRTVVNGQPSWLVSGYADVQAVLRSPGCGVRPPGRDVPAHVGRGPAGEFYRLSLVSVDAPDHTRLRRLVARSFTPRTLKTMRGWVGEIVSAALDDLAGVDGPVDFVDAFAARVPAEVACRLLHAPAEDARELLARQPPLNPLLSQGELTADALDAANEAAQFYFDYIGDLIESLRGWIGPEDPVGALLATDGEGAQLTRSELVVTLVGLLIAGYHTSMVALTNAVYRLLTHDGCWSALGSDPGLAGPAWEEVLRYDPPVHFTWRYAQSALTVSGTEIAPGSHLLLALAAANRDHRRFPHAGQLDIRRADNRHLSFVTGPHGCLGAPLARIEGELALAGLAERFPALALVPGAELERLADLSFPMIPRLPVSVHGR